MLYCEKCGIHLTGSMRRCPLCQSELSGTPEENAYPVIPDEKKRYWFAVRLMALITVVAIAVCTIVNFSFPGNRWWFLFVAAGFATAWLIVGIAVWKRSNPLKSVLWQLAVISVLLLLWDWCTGFIGWSINFVLPIAIPCVQLAMIAMAWILRLKPSDYMLYLMICVIFGFVPLVLLLSGAVEVIYPSIVCAGISAIVLAALVLFKGSAMRDEIVRRMHL